MYYLNGSFSAAFLPASPPLRSNCPECPICQWLNCSLLYTCFKIDNHIFFSFLRLKRGLFFTTYNFSRMPLLCRVSTIFHNTPKMSPDLNKTNSLRKTFYGSVRIRFCNLNFKEHVTPLCHVNDVTKITLQMFSVVSLFFRLKLRERVMKRHLMLLLLSV